MRSKNGTKRTVRRLAPLLLVAAAVGCRGSETVDAYLSDLDSRHAITASVLVARDGALLVNRGYGLADEDLRLPNTPRTRFRIGSITKQFTAAAILLLKERGRLSVQDPVCSYFSPCPQAWSQVTLEHLLTHTSGIPSYTAFSEFSALLGTPVSVDDLIARFSSMPLLFTPGSRWSYSNSGYIVLGALVERLSGRTYADFLQENVFTPLGMADSGYDSDDPAPPLHATGYLRPGVKPVRFSMSEVYAAGALYSTVEDLYAWDLALLANRLVNADDLAAMTTPHISCPSGGCALGDDTGYGYGWFVAAEPAGTYVYHWGHIDGFVTSNGFYAAQKTFVVVLSNLETTDAFAISTRLAELAAR